MTHKATLAVRTGIETDTQHGAVVPPIYLSSNYTFADFGEPRQYDYARSGNPTRTNLADALAALEGGAGAVVTGTGMGAVHLVTTALLKAGDLLIAPHDCYGGTWRLFEYLAAKGHYQVQFVDQGDEVALAAALAQKPALVWVETPSNPLLRVVDIAAIAEAARRVQCPVLLISGGRSDLVSEKTVEEFKQLVPHARHVHLPQATHMVAGDDNDAFTATVLEYLAELDRTEGTGSSAEQRAHAPVTGANP